MAARGGGGGFARGGGGGGGATMMRGGGGGPRAGGGATMMRGGGGGPRAGGGITMMRGGGPRFQPGGAVMGRGAAPGAGFRPPMMRPLAPAPAAPILPHVAPAAPPGPGKFKPPPPPPPGPGKKPPWWWKKPFPKGGGGFFAPPSWWGGPWGPWWWSGGYPYGYPYVEEYIVPVYAPSDCGSFVAERDVAASAAPDGARMALREARAGQHKPRCPTACAPVLENLGGTWTIVYYMSAGSTCPPAPGDNFMGVPVVYTAFVGTVTPGIYGTSGLNGVLEVLGPMGVVAILAGVGIWATIKFGPKTPDVPPEYVLAGGRRRSRQPEW